MAPRSPRRQSSRVPTTPRFQSSVQASKGSKFPRLGFQNFKVLAFQASRFQDSKISGAKERFQSPLVPGCPGYKIPSARCPRIPDFQIRLPKVSKSAGYEFSTIPWFHQFQGTSITAYQGSKAPTVPGFPGSRVLGFHNCKTPCFKSWAACICTCTIKPNASSLFHVGTKEFQRFDFAW